MLRCGNIARGQGSKPRDAPVDLVATKLTTEAVRAAHDEDADAARMT